MSTRRFAPFAELLLCAFAALGGRPARADIAPPSTPAPAAPEPPAAPPAVDPLQEARDLIELAANTKENLKKAIALYEGKLDDASLGPKVRSDGWADVSRAYLRLGDLETAKASKLDAYKKGREAGQKGTAIDPKHTDALFWATANLATTGRTNGVMNSLFMLGDLRKDLNRVLELDRNHKLAKQTLGEIDHAVPGIAGGSDERAETAWKEILARDPSYTPVMALLAKFYRDKGKKDEARKYAKMCLEVPKSSVPSDWKKFNKKDAQEVLAELDK